MLPSRSLLICTSPRSGSNWLCDLLARTGECGYPSEYFATGLESFYRRQFPFADLTRQAVVFDHILRMGSTNRFFAAKAFWVHLEGLAAKFHAQGEFPERDGLDILGEQLPNLLLVRLKRTDRLRQAISFVRARATNAWWQGDGAPSRPGEECRYDFVAIRRAVHQLETWERRWDERLQRTSRPRFTLTYADMQNDLHNAMQRLLSFLGIEAGHDGFETRLRRQADAITDEWVDRFLDTDNGRTSIAIGRDLARQAASLDDVTFKQDARLRVAPPVHHDLIHCVE